MQGRRRHTPADAGASFSRQGDGLVATLSGRLDAAGVTALWDRVVREAGQPGYTSLTADLSGVTYLDGAGVALLLKLRQLASGRGAAMNLANLRPEDRKMIELTWSAELPDFDRERDRRDMASAVSEATSQFWLGIRSMVTFVGEASSLLVQAVLHPTQVRWKDVLLSCVHVGEESLFIILLIGFLMGLIMSFQSAISLQRFGGEIFVPNMLGLVMFREMGPLVTSILLAARSGSAFAAEIGTMKINEELDALTTMGLSPMRFLVVPKLLATMMVIPMMTMFFNLASLVGGAVVMLSLGYPLVTFTSRVFAYLDLSDFWGGMTKALVFSFLVAGVGCLRGMQTKTGASAVGLSTTSAVVSGIILIAFADGLFAMAFYYLNL